MRVRTGYKHLDRMICGAASMLISMLILAGWLNLVIYWNINPGLSAVIVLACMYICGWFLEGGS